MIVKCLLFTLDLLNGRSKCFPYFEITNKPTPINISFILKGRISYSAAEMLNLVLYFGLMVGDVVPDDDVWLYYKTLRTLTNVCLHKSFYTYHVGYLRSLIEEHHTLYMSVFNKKLKPKHHHLVHYPTCLTKCGSFTHYWSMRFESKHTLIKLIAAVSRSNINLCKTVLLRYIYIISHDLFFAASKLSYVSDVGPAIEEAAVNCYRWVVRKGIKFSEGNLVCIGYNSEDHMPTFGKIALISVRNDAIFKVKQLKTLCLDSHMTGYVVSMDSNDYVNVLGCVVSLPLVSMFINDRLYVADLGLE